jgi:hypothetical protein
MKVIPDEQEMNEIDGTGVVEQEEECTKQVVSDNKSNNGDSLFSTDPRTDLSGSSKFDMDEVCILL